MTVTPKPRRGRPPKSDAGSGRRVNTYLTGDLVAVVEAVTQAPVSGAAVAAALRSLAERAGLIPKKSP